MISVTILTKNSERYFPEVLKALARFPEVLIYDNGSTDNTLGIAKQFPNTRCLTGPFIGFGPTHQYAAELAHYDWILSIDSDEVISQEAVEAIYSLALDPKCVYRFMRHNYFNGKWIRWCGWHPERVVRLFNRRTARFSQDMVHEKIISDNLQLIDFQEPIDHTPYASIADFLQKMQLYSDLFAKQHCGKKRSSLMKALTHGLFAFFKTYLLQRGFLGGYEGFVISAYNGHTAYYKYLKLAEANRLRALSSRREF